jgi:hypothetical protein
MLALPVALLAIAVGSAASGSRSLASSVQVTGSVHASSVTVNGVSSSGTVWSYDLFFACTEDIVSTEATVRSLGASAVITIKLTNLVQSAPPYAAPYVYSGALLQHGSPVRIVKYADGTGLNLSGPSRLSLHMMLPYGVYLSYGEFIPLEGRLFAP